MMQKNNGLDNTTLIAGFLFGLIAGVAAALFKPASSSEPITHQIGEATHLLRNKIESIAHIDPISESLAEGKAAARQRRAELGSGNRN